MLTRGYISHTTAWWGREVVRCTISTSVYRTLAMLTGNVGLVFWRQKRKYWRSVALTSSMPLSADANTVCPNCVEWVWPKICEIATLLGIQKRFLYLRIALWHNLSLRMHRWATSRHQRYVVTPIMSAMAAFFWRVTILGSRLGLFTMSSPSVEPPSSSSPCRALPGEGNQVKGYKKLCAYYHYCVHCFVFDTKTWWWWSPLGATESSPTADSASCWSPGRRFYPKRGEQPGEMSGMQPVISTLHSVCAQKWVK